VVIDFRNVFFWYFQFSLTRIQCVTCTQAASAAAEAAPAAAGPKMTMVGRDAMAPNVGLEPAPVTSELLELTTEDSFQYTSLHLAVIGGHLEAVSS